MNTYDFSIQDVAPRTTNQDYVILQAGKGKSKYSKMYINSSGFSYIEGLIWDKHREFRHKKTKNHIRGLKRIIGGLQTAQNALKQPNHMDRLEEILRFGIVNPTNPIADLESYISEFQHMVEDIIDWLDTHTQTEKYIFVIKNHL